MLALPNGRLRASLPADDREQRMPSMGATDTERITVTQQAAGAEQNSGLQIEGGSVLEFRFDTRATQG